MAKKTPRNAPCPCGSGRKYKHCCLHKPATNKPEKADTFTSPEQSIEPSSYAGPDGGYAPAIRFYLPPESGELADSGKLVNPRKRYCSRAAARNWAARDLTAAAGAEESPFSSGGTRLALEVAGYIPEPEVDLSCWADQLEELAEEGHPQCGLCGNTIDLAKTACCDN